MSKKRTAKNIRETNNARVIVRNDGEELMPSEEEVSCYLPHIDHLLCVSPKDVASVVPKFIHGTFRTPAESKSLAITCPEYGEVDLSPILNAAEEWIEPYSSITLHRCHVPRAILERLVARWYGVTLIGCALAPGWQSRKDPSSKCNWITFRGCTAAAPDELEVGCASWPRLECLQIDEDHWDRKLTSSTAIQPDPLVVHRSPYQTDPSQLMKAFWGSGVTSLILCDWREPPRLIDLPELRNLDDVLISGTPTKPKDLEWIARHSKVFQLGLSWLPEEKMPWGQLASLSKLRYLDVTSSPCDDEDLIQILDHTRLRTIHLYYSRVTSGSWARLLSTPSLKSVWVSTEAMKGPQPSGLPAQTGLEEVVALNAGTAYLEELLKKYPGVAIVEM